MIKHLQTKMLLLLGLLLAGVGTAWADTFTIGWGSASGDNSVNFTATSGTVQGIVSFTTDKGGGSAPAYNENSKQLRLYYGSNGNGGSITLTPASGVTITAAVVYSDTKPSVAYTVDGGTATSVSGVSSQTSNYSYTVSNISATTSLKFQNVNTSNTQLKIELIEITYTKDTSVPSISFAETEAEVTVGKTYTQTATTANADNAEVSYSSSATDIATVNSSTGEVTGVAAGKATITASMTVNNSEYTASYEITVNEAIEEVSGLTVDFETGNLNSYVDWTFTNVGIHSTQITAHDGTYYAANLNANDSGVTSCVIATKEKVATPGILTFYVSKESSNTTSSNWNVEISEDNSTWTKVGDSQSATSMSKGEWTEVTRDLSNYTNVYVRISYSGSTAIRAIDDISISEASAVAVKAPVFSVEGGDYTEAQTVEITCETEGATIYYTLDGTAPTANSTEYTQAITIGESCTLKAIAIKDNDVSSVTTASYTIVLPLTTIAQIKEQAINSIVNVQLTDAQVVFVSGNDIYVRDATGAMDFYKSGITELATGDIFDATIEATYSPYKGMPELVTFTTKTITKKDNSTVVAKVIDAEGVADNVCDLVKFENVQLTLTDNNYYIGETGIQLYDKFNAGYMTTTGADADVSGVVIPFGNSAPYTYEICPRVAGDIVYLDNSVAVSIGSAGMATFCSEEALDFSGVDAIEVYIATVDGSDITFTKVTKVPAQTGVLLRNALGESAGAVDEVNVPVLSGEADNVEGNAFVGVLEEIASLASEDGNNGTNYILNNGTNGLGFYKANGQKVAAGKAYLYVAGGNARTFIGFGGETGISTVESTVASENAIFNLSGQRVMQPTKGLYIVGGKKVVMK